jgi:exosome complex component CSL4
MVEMQKQNRKIVIPGDEIATAEEYIPGPNTFEDRGKIISLIYGFLNVDETNLSVSVVPVKSKPKIFVGSIVYGRVVEVERGRAVIEVSAMTDKEQKLVEYYSIGKAEIPESRERSNEPSMLIGDLVRGKVIGIYKSELKIGLLGKNLGVLKTICPRCRTTMIKKGSMLYCPNCERTEFRKVADDYGDIVPEGVEK